MIFSRGLVSSIIICCLVSTSIAYENKEVHPEINEKALRSSCLENVLQKNGFSSGLGGKFMGKNTIEWIRLGGTEEDEPSSRALRHFHDPTKKWDSAGIWFVKQWESSLVWAQTNDSSWQVARNHYWGALTFGYQDEYAATFKALGQLMHLISDKAVPAHVRDDAHPEVMLVDYGFPISHYEVWTKKHVNELNYNGVAPDKSIFSYPVLEEYQQYSPIALLWDTDKYDTTNPEITLDPVIGLAEYTNANFFSEGTVFEKYPHPTNDSNIEEITRSIPDPFDQGNEVARKYWQKKAIENINSYLLSGVGYLYFYVDSYHPDLNYKDFERLAPMDERVFKDYANLLVPRAVGYSTALLDYFFRGKIEIERPIVKFDSKSSITELTFSIKNGTPPINENQTVEPFESGYITLAYSYTDANNDVIYNWTDPYIYSISGIADPINGEYVPITVSLPVPVPVGAKHFSFTLVFKGKLGNEEGAVVGKRYTFDNSRIAYFYQPDGPKNRSNVYTIDTDGSHPYDVTAKTAPNPWYFSPTWSKDGTKMAFEEEYCTEENHDPLDPNSFCPQEQYFRDIVVIDLLSDQSYPDNLLARVNSDGIPAANPAFSPDGTKIVALEQEQTGFFLYDKLVLFDLETNSKEILNTYDSGIMTNLYGSNPSWSPKGDSIAYYMHSQYDEQSGSLEVESDIFLIDPVTKTRTRLTNDDYFNLQPSWSPDGEWIVFSSDRDDEESMDIWLMDKNGENHRRLVDCTPASCYSPTFSPDGSKVAFSNGSSIYTVDIDGDPTTVKSIAKPGLSTGALNWSPFISPPAIDAQADQSAVIALQPVTISWQSEGATEVYVSGVTEKQPANGSITVFPDSTTTYTITAVGATGTDEATVTVVVQ